MTPQDQMNLAKVMQEKETAKGNLFSTRLNTEIFPSDKLSKMWRTMAYDALIKSQPMSHRLSLIEFSKVIDCDIYGDITLFQFGVLSNSIEAVSQHDLNLSTSEYLEFINEAIGHIEWYGKHIAKIRDEIQLQVDKDFQMKTAALDGKNILKPVKAEA